ncbi:MAG: hypothetical protein L0Z62_35175 [Gemmataceae bacterium]|nr:hypothetical protein [Gemmataceae bacterium]
MTEADWLACTEPTPMLEFVFTKAGPPSDRKYLLLACACCRRIWHLLTDERFRQAVDFTERYVDGRESEEDSQVLDLRLCTLLTQQFGNNHSTMTTEGLAAELAVDLLAQNPAVAADCATRRLPWLMEREEKKAEEVAYQCGLLRDLFGNPFRPASLDPSWLTPKVVALARTIHDDRALNRIPELADALEEAGCTNTDILAHCRGLGGHVRGCWVVDLLLGKE